MGTQKVRIDLTGLQFGHLTVLEFAGTDKWGAARWKCRCDLDGNETIVLSDSLRRGLTKSCGCQSLSKGESNPRYAHGYAMTRKGFRTPEYCTWSQMKRRCHNPKSKDYKDYGGRGIYVCERWRKSFQDFLQDVGRKPTPKHSLDRINNDGGYEPGNCRWATSKEQAQNRRPRRCPHCHEILWPSKNKG